MPSAGSSGSVPPAAGELRVESDAPAGAAPAPQAGASSRPTGDLVVELNATVKERGVHSVYVAIADLGGARADDPLLRAALVDWRRHGQLTWPEAFRCVAAQTYGAEPAWPLPVRNFAEGLDGGAYQITDLPPSGAGLLEFCVKAAERAANGVLELRARYISDFNARFDSPRFAALSTQFDAETSSKGPRNPRARAVFRELYALAEYKSAYDTNQPAGFRELCDTMVGPDGPNLIASPRLHALRAVLAGDPVHVRSTMDPRFAMLVAQVVERVRALDARDRQELEREHAWRLAVDAKVLGPSPGVTRTVRAALWGAVLAAHASSAQAVPGGPPASEAPASPRSAYAPVETAQAVSAPSKVATGDAEAVEAAEAATTPTPTPGHAAAPGAARRANPVPMPPAPAGPAAPEHGCAAAALAREDEQRTFLSSVSFAAPASVEASGAEQALRFDVRGAPNPGIGIHRRVVVEPAPRVIAGASSDALWAPGATSVDHVARVDPTPVTGNVSTFQARLTVRELANDVFPARSTSVEVIDRRPEYVISHLRPGLRFLDFTDRTLLPAGGTAHYTGKQCPITVTPNFGGNPNPGMHLQIDGALESRGRRFDFARADFGMRATELALFQTILLQHDMDGAAEEWTLTLHVFRGGERAAFHTITHPFRIAKTPAATLADDKDRMARDNAWLNQSIDTDGSLLHHMVHKGGDYERVAQHVARGRLRVRACFIRSDSADQVARLAGVPATLDRVAYAMGEVDPLGRGGNTLVSVPGAAGFRWPAHPDTIFANATPVPGGAHRSLDEVAEFLAHEARHAMDRITHSTWGRYETEFRAYWFGPELANLSTAFDPSLIGNGPKSPRARKIFEMLYRSQTYPFVKQAYDANESGFRERADNYHFPDGINLTLSPELAALRAAIEAAKPGHLAETRTLLAQRYAACSPADANEVSTNRAWRDLVEEKFNPREGAPIKDMLKIPR